MILVYDSEKDLQRNAVLLSHNTHIPVNVFSILFGFDLEIDQTLYQLVDGQLCKWEFC